MNKRYILEKKDDTKCYGHGDYRTEHEYLIRDTNIDHMEGFAGINSYELVATFCEGHKDEALKCLKTLNGEKE